MKEEKGWTIVYFPWDDADGKPRVARRCKTTKEKNSYLENIYNPESGWTDEELSSVTIINDYNYQLPR